MELRKFVLDILLHTPCSVLLSSERLSAESFECCFQRDVPDSAPRPESSELRLCLVLEIASSSRGGLAGP